MTLEIFFFVLLFCESVREGWRPQNWGGQNGWQESNNKGGSKWREKEVIWGCCMRGAVISKFL